MNESIYGAWKDALPQVLHSLVSQIEDFSEKRKEETGEAAYEHLIYRIKSEDSMREKCRRKGLPENASSALYDIHDAIGIRIVCCFLNDIYENMDFIRSIPGCTIVKEKDYIKSAKPNGYRSCHLIVEMEAPFADVKGAKSGPFLCGNPAPHHCHGFLGQSGTPDEVQEEHQKPGNDYPGTEALRR